MIRRRPDTRPRSSPLPRGCALATAVLVALAAMPATATEQKLYRWVDRDGRVHYSDTVPPDHAGQRREVKTPEGATVRTVPPPPTREELEAEERRRQAEAEERARQEEIQRRRLEHDRMLLLTFTSVEEMRTARDERLRAIESQISLVESRIEKLHERRARLREEVTAMERTGRGNAAEVYREMEAIDRSIAQNRQAIRDKRASQERIRERFAEDIARFQELMAERERENR